MDESQQQESTLGGLIDKLATKRSEIAVAEGKVQALKLEEKEIEDELIERFGKAEIDGAHGTICRAKIQKKDYVSIQDRAVFNAWVAENKAFDLYQARLNKNAWKARIDNGESVPGVRIFTKTEVKTVS